MIGIDLGTRRALPRAAVRLRRVRLPERLAVSLLLLALIGLYFWPVLAGGLVLSPVDAIFDYAFFRQDAPAGYQHPANPLLTDPVQKFYPWQVAAREALRDGEFPFWNPAIYAGAPLFANAESAVLYPLNLIGYLLPLQRALVLSAIARMFVAGFGMFLFLRGVRLGAFGATIAAIAFMFGGSLVVWLNYPVANAYAWLPLLFFLGDRLIATGRPRYVALLGLVNATQILGGHFQTSFMMLLAWGLYLLYRLGGDLRRRGDWRRAGARLALAALGAASGILIAAPQLVLFAEWLGQSNEVALRLQDRGWTLLAPAFWKNLATVATFALPDLLGNPTSGSALSYVHSNYLEQMGYIGIIPLALAIGAVVATWRGEPRPPDGAAPAAAPGAGWVRFQAALGVGALGLALRVPGLDLVNQLPVFSVVASDRYRLIYTFCACALAGVGADHLLRAGAGGVFARHLARGLISFAALAGALLLGIRAALALGAAQVASIPRLAAVYPDMLRAFGPANVKMYLPVLLALACALALLAARRRMLRPDLVLAACTGLIVLDLFTFGARLNPASPGAQVFPATAATRFLQDRLAQEGPGRVVAMDDTLPPNTGAPYGLREIAGTDFPGRRYAELLLAAGATMPSHFRIAFPVLHPQLLDLLGVRYIVAGGAPAGMPAEQVRAIYRDANIQIYANSGALPRAYLVHRAEVPGDDVALLARLLAPDFDPARTVLLEGPAPALDPTGAAHPDDRVELLEDGRQRLRLRVTTASPGYLFLGDADYPGWRATIDGQARPIYRADYAFRAVYVPAGEHEVAFSYVPTGLTLSLVLCLLGATIVLLCAAGWRRAGS